MQRVGVQSTRKQMKAAPWLLAASLTGGMLMSPVSASAANEYHVDDEVTIFMHSGPSNQYRIKARVSSGTALTLLDRNANTDYVRVRTDEGTVGWIQSRYLAEGNSKFARMPELENNLTEARTALETEREKVTRLSAQLKQAREAHQTEVSQINNSRAETTAHVAQLENEINRLQNTIDGMDESNLMGWFVRGGGVALAGILLGLLIPKLPKRRRRTDEWF